MKTILIAAVFTLLGNAAPGSKLIGSIKLAPESKP
jgi:hypothetical protein